MAIYKQNKKVIAMYKNGAKVTSMYRYYPDLGKIKLFSYSSNSGSTSGNTSTELKCIVDTIYGSSTFRFNDIDYQYTSTTLEVTIDQSEFGGTITSCTSAFTNTQLVEIEQMFDFSNVRHTDYMFYNCRNIREIDATGWNIYNVVTYENMLSGCDGLRTIILGTVDEYTYEWWQSRIDEAGIRCEIVYELTDVNTPMLLKFEWEEKPNTSPQYYLVYSEDGNNLNNDYITPSNNPETFEINNPPNYLKNVVLHALNVTKIINFPTGATLGDLSATFSNYIGEELTLNNLKLSDNQGYGVTNNLSFFRDNNYIKKLTVNNWYVPGVTSEFFLTNFIYNSSVEELQMDNWEIPNVTMLQSILRSDKLKKLSIKNLVTNKIISLGNSLSNIGKVEELDLSTWDVSNVTSLYNMFGNAQSLTTLDISGWNIKSDATVSMMFINCNNLNLIKLGDCNQITLDKIMEGIQSSYLGRQPEIEYNLIG